MSTACLPARPSLEPLPQTTNSASGQWTTGIFWVWLVWRTAAWSLAAATQANPPLDTVEWLCWGGQWQLGYHKHPPLPAWIAETVFRLAGDRFVAVYLSGFLFVALALISVWRMASALLPPRPALAATLCLDGLVYLGPAACEYNNHLPLIAFWSLSVWLFHRALSGNRWHDWAGLGVSLGLALLCKHSAIFLIAPLLAVWAWYDGRRWSRPAVVALAAALVVLPHAMWLHAQDYPTLRYAARRTQGEPGALDPRLSVLVFLLGQAVRLTGVLAILWPVLLWRRRCLTEQAERARRVLLVALLGPVVLHLALGLVFGMRLRDIWGAPLWTFAGVGVLALVQSDDSDRAWRRFFFLWALVSAGLLAWTLAGTSTRAQFPGRRMSTELTQRYEAVHGVPPAVVAGDWWLAGNVCVHASHRPALYGSVEPSFLGMAAQVRAGRVREPQRFYAPEPATSPWTSDADLRQRGGILVWDAEAFGDGIPRVLHERFPQALRQPALVVPWRTERSVRVGWATLAPGPPGAP